MPTDLITDLKIGDKLNAVIAKQTIQVELLAIGKQVDPINRTVELRLALVNQAQIFNGQLVKVAIEKQIVTQGFWLPLSALIDGVRGQWNIYLAEPLKSATDKKLYQIKSTVVNVKHTRLNQAFVTGLPLQSQQIIVEGVHRFVPMQKVTLTTHKGKL